MIKIKQLINFCIKENITISTAESCTGGALSAAITSVPGASKIFAEGFIVYSDNAKMKYLSISEKTLKKYGAVSEPIAQEMAYNCRLLANSSIAISITGIAGPGNSGIKPEGRVCFGISTKDQLISKTIEFGAIGRNKVRKNSVSRGIELIISQLKM